MKWDRLKDMKCPKCGGQLSVLLYCKDVDCNFSISQAKFDRLVGSMYKPKIPTHNEDDNLEFLNNFDRPIIRDDFSDSPVLEL